MTLAHGQLCPAHSDLLDTVRAYWDVHVSDWKVASHKVGTKEYFVETETYRFEKLNYLDRLVESSAYPGRRLLDVGCGLGNDTSRFAQGGVQVVGIDLAERAIQLSRTNFSQRGLAGDFYVMNGEQIEFPDQSFDLVYCHTVLHFTPDPARMIREIHRVLKPGGRAILVTVNRHSWLKLLHKLMNVEIDYLDAPVFRWFTQREFRALLSPFADVKVVFERFPVRTKVHEGIKARLYNAVFVDLFNALPRSWIARSGYHLVAFASKSENSNRRGGC